MPNVPRAAANRTDRPAGAICSWPSQRLSASLAGSPRGLRPLGLLRMGCGLPPRRSCSCRSRSPSCGRLLRRDVGVDAIALVSMAGALALGEYLAGAVVALMLAGGNALEERANRGRHAS